MIPKINSSHGSETRNIINRAIEVLNVQGKTIQDLVAEGQLTEEQYAELITAINGLLKSGEVDKSALTQELRYEINLLRGKIDKGNVSINDLSPQLLELINNSDGTPFEILSIPRDGSVTEEKTTFIDVSTNLFNPHTLEKNKSFSSNGNVVDSDTRSITDFISIQPGSHFHASWMGSYVAYDENKNFISQGFLEPRSLGESRLVNNLTYFIRIEVVNNRIEEAQLNIGEEKLPYEPFYRKIKSYIDVDYSIKENEVTRDKIAPRSVGFSETDFIKQSTNLIVKSSLIPQTTINSVGERVYNESNNTTQSIKVKPNSRIQLKGVARIGEYDNSGDFIRTIELLLEQTINGHSLILTNNTHSVILVIYDGRIDEAQANEGETLLPYEEGHNPRLSEEIEVVGAEDGNEDEILDVKNDDYFVTDSLTENYYKQVETLPGRDRAKGSTALNEMFDVFPATHPDYITKEQIAMSNEGKPIYLLDFNPDIVGEPVPETTFPEIFIVCGIHGTERVPPEIAYRAFDLIYNHWEDNKILEYLRWNVRFKLIPLLNPDGWNNDTRQNENLIDLNRQFPDDWVLQPEGASVYGGTEPLTEPEAIAVNQLLEEGKDKFVYVCDFHNFSSGGYNFIWNAGGTVFNNNLAKTLVSKTSREWKKRYDWYVDGSEGLRGYANWTPGGSVARRASALGMQSSTFEFTMGNDLDPLGETYSSNIMTLGTEAFINWLYLNVKNNIHIINRNRK